jgi:hypothetical protein
MKPTVCLALAASLFFGLLPNLQAGEDLRSIVNLAAENISSYLKSRSETTLAINIRGPASFPASGITFLEQALGEALAARGITIKPTAAIAVKGELKPTKLETALEARLNITLVNRFDDPLFDADLGGIIRDADEISRLLGLTIDTAKVNDFDQRERLLDSFNKPSFVTTGGLVRPDKDSEFAVEIFVNNKTRTPRNEGGLAFLPVQFGEEYALRLVNDSKREMAAEVFVDGLSAFHFSEARSNDPERKGESRFRYYILGPGEKLDVPGWFITKTRSRGFKVAPVEDSLAFKLGKTQKIGTITVVFSYCFKDEKEAQAFENADFAKSRPTPSPLAYVVPTASSKYLVKIDPDKPVTIQPRDKQDKPIPIKVYPDINSSRFQDLLARDLETADGRRRWKAKEVPPDYVHMEFLGAGTTFGTDQGTDFQGVSRSIGRQAASISVRYDIPRR